MSLPGGAPQPVDELVHGLDRFASDGERGTVLLAPAVDLAREVADRLAEFFLARDLFGVVELPADFAGGIVKRYLVPAFGGDGERQPVGDAGEVAVVGGYPSESVRTAETGLDADELPYFCDEVLPRLERMGVRAKRT